MAGRHGAQRFPIRFTNELEVFYPGVEHVQLLDRHDSLRLGTRFETNLAGQDVFASVEEFKPMTRIAWGGYPKVSEESRAYHSWSITPTPNGGHLWTEETMHGRHWIELAKKLPMPFGASSRSFLQISPRSRANAKAVATKLLSPSGGLG